jgi:hypothetical protein
MSWSQVASAVLAGVVYALIAEFILVNWGVLPVTPVGRLLGAGLSASMGTMVFAFCRAFAERDGARGAELRADLPRPRSW